MASDAATFGWAFLVVWGSLGAYFVYVHRLAVRLRERLDGLDGLDGKGGRDSDAAEGNLK